MNASLIDPSARIESGARIGPNVSVGPYCTIGPHVSIGENCRLVAHVNLGGHTTIGARTVIYPFASLGSPPQSTHYRGGPTRLVVGSDCDIRENVTISTGTEDDRGITEVGNHCFLMVGSHVAHDCKIGDNVVFGNNTLLAGHVSVGDNVVFGGGAAVRQFVRIGEGAMVVGLSGARADVIPWGTIQGPLAHLVGVNVVGMRRRGFAKAEIHRYREAYMALFFGSDEFHARVERVAATYEADPWVAKMIEFIRSGTRPLTMAVKRREVDGDE
jgi:UDP-N-acetylglucosamine acyltransferase